MLPHLQPGLGGSSTKIHTARRVFCDNHANRGAHTACRVEFAKHFDRWPCSMTPHWQDYRLCVGLSEATPKTVSSRLVAMRATKLSYGVRNRGSNITCVDTTA